MQIKSEGDFTVLSDEPYCFLQANEEKFIRFGSKLVEIASCISDRHMGRLIVRTRVPRDTLFNPIGRLWKGQDFSGENLTEQVAGCTLGTWHIVSPADPEKRYDCEVLHVTQSVYEHMDKRTILWLQALGYPRFIILGEYDPSLKRKDMPFLFSDNQTLMTVSLATLSGNGIQKQRFGFRVIFADLKPILDDHGWIATDNTVKMTFPEKYSGSLMDEFSY